MWSIKQAPYYVSGNGWWYENMEQETIKMSYMFEKGKSKTYVNKNIQE